MLTQIGEAFAGRVAASLLNAIGLKELITTTGHDYETLAIELATNSEKLAAVRRNWPTIVSQNHCSIPNHSLDRSETAYRAMYQRHQVGLPPDHIYVSQ